MSEPNPIDANALAELVRAGVAKKINAVQAGHQWAVEATIGQDVRPLRTQRTDVKLWSSLDTVANYLKKHIGVVQFGVRMSPHK